MYKYIVACHKVVNKINKWEHKIFTDLNEAIEYSDNQQFDGYACHIFDITNA